MAITEPYKMDDIHVHTLPDGRSWTTTAEYYLASCDSCGWIGSSEECVLYHYADDADVGCPKCGQSGVDCGRVAGTADTNKVESP